MTELTRTVVRTAGPGDVAALQGLVGRASATTLRRRFHGAGDRIVRREVDRIAHPSRSHRSWVAVSPDGAVRGTATLAAGRDGTVEAAFLVEDGWFRRGIGRSLFTALAAEADCAGVATVLARVQADNERAIRFLRSLRVGVEAHFVGDGEVEVQVPVAVAARRLAPVAPEVAAPPVTPPSTGSGGGSPCPPLVVEAA
jgi:GNAT superfamily N-acetyltransferase